MAPHANRGPAVGLLHSEQQESPTHWGARFSCSPTYLTRGTVMRTIRRLLRPRWGPVSCLNVNATQLVIFIRQQHNLCKSVPSQVGAPGRTFAAKSPESREAFDPTSLHRRTTPRPQGARSDLDARRARLACSFPLFNSSFGPP